MGATSDTIREHFPDLVLHSHAAFGDETVCVRPEGVAPVARFLKYGAIPAFDVLVDLTAVDYPGEDPRFEMVYHFYSLVGRIRLRMKARVSGDPPEIDSLVSLWKGANWYEREVWDMFGVRFRGHPDLRRILMYDGFEGHPLRKDYPIRKRQPLVGPVN